MFNKFCFKKKIIIILFIQLLFIQNVYSKNIESFNIIGNDRVSKETIIMFSSLNIGDEINDNLLNDALKKLYYTDYFKQVELSVTDQIINISVIENPIIQSVIVEGVNVDSLEKKIKEVTLKIEKYPFVENKVNDQVVLLKNILKSYGYYFVELETSINKNLNNTVDLRYSFELGEVAKIKNINFIGNKIFSDTILRNIILSEEAKFWKFITKNKFLDINRINADTSRLRKFYKNRGYYDVKIKSTSAIITDQNQFELIFNIDAGTKFYFNNISLADKKNFSENDLTNFEKSFKNLEGKTYSEKKINNLIDDINEFTLKNDFVFLNANYDKVIKEDDKIDVIIKLDDLDKKFVERINILGNFITDEKVIRNTLIID